MRDSGLRIACPVLVYATIVQVVTTRRARVPNTHHPLPILHLSMSRAQFPSNPSRRTKSPAAYDANPSTLPLSINRQPARPMTPTSSTGSAMSRGSPARPARSDLRPRQISQYSINSVSSRGMDRDSMAYDVGGESRMPETQLQSDRSEDGEATSPKALTAVLNAFQQAGAQRKRAMTNGTLERERERERELQAEAERQKRIKDRVPGRRVNGRTKTAGGIDGMCMKSMTTSSR